MPVTWEFRGPLLTLSFVGVVEKDEIASAFTEALSDARARPGMRLPVATFTDEAEALAWLEGRPSSGAGGSGSITSDWPGLGLETDTQG